MQRSPRSILVRTALPLILLASGGPLHAEWTGGLEGGTVVSDGTSSTRVRGSLQNNERPLTHSLYADWIRYSDGNGYRVGYVPRFWLNEKLYLHGQGEYRTDRPLGIDNAYQLTAGAGYRLINSEQTSLGVEVGAGVRGTDFESIDNDLDSELEEPEAIASVRLDGNRLIGEMLRADFDAKAIQGERIGELNANVGLSWRVAQGAIRVGYSVRRLSVDDLPTVTDDRTSVGFTVGF